MTRIHAAFLIALLVGLAACKDGMPSVAEIQQRVDASLKPGDSESKIIEVLKKTGWPYQFNDIENIYETAYPKTTKNILGIETSLRIRIFVNKDRSFNHAVIDEANGWF
jgi:hypothetical protein